MPAQPKTLYMKVSSRIVAELPRFFGSFETAIGEMFQNAYSLNFAPYQPNKRELDDKNTRWGCTFTPSNGGNRSSVACDTAPTG